ncbi:MAG: hypothetical protein ACRYG7_43870 [Janthinobacterium lividum]
MTAATSKKLPNGQYQVDFTVKSAKFYADSLGNQKPADQSHHVLPVAIFPELGKNKKPVAPLLLKRRLRAGDNKLRFVVSSKPASVAVDPYHLLIDRKLEDNIKEL